jgi:hypothetical protein
MMSERPAGADARLWELLREAMTDRRTAVTLAIITDREEEVGRHTDVHLAFTGNQTPGDILDTAHSMLRQAHRLLVEGKDHCKACANNHTRAALALACLDAKGGEA